MVSAVNGLIGDRLARASGSDLAITMAVRRRRPRRRRSTATALAAAFPRATGDVVVFLHGLCENEAYWDRAPRRERRHGYGEPARRARAGRRSTCGPTPACRSRENGVALAALLDDLVAAWPTDVRRIALVGHSMGGLVMRAACAVSTDASAPWTDLVTDVVTPRHAAPRRAARARRRARAPGRSARLPESAPFGRILEYRSVGILDLRGGLAHDVQNLPHARYRLVAATLDRARAGTRSAETLGDLLVPLPVGARPPAPRAGDVPGRRRAARPGRTTSTCSTIPR